MHVSTEGQVHQALIELINVQSLQFARTQTVDMSRALEFKIGRCPYLPTLSLCGLVIVTSPSVPYVPSY